MNIREIGLEVVDWIHLVQDTEKWPSHYEHSNELSGSIKG